MKKILLTLALAAATLVCLAGRSMMSCHPLKNKAMKRSFLSVVALLALVPYLFAQRPDTLKLWPAGTPSPYHTDYRYEGKDYSEAMLVVFRAPKPNGLAVVMCPGGGYMMEAQEHEGTDLAGWFTARGITYCMLQYRLPDFRYTTAPLEDAQEAVRTVRAHAQEWGVRRVGVSGCSAGGHLASTLATHYTADSRPDFQILFYPVITMDPSYTHRGSHDALLGRNPAREQEELYSNEKQVTSDTPPAFIMASSDDDLVPVRNSVNYYLALVDHGVSASLHFYPGGGHGWGFRDSFIYKQDWTSELDKWLREVAMDQ